MAGHLRLATRDGLRVEEVPSRTQLAVDTTAVALLAADDDAFAFDDLAERAKNDPTPLTSPATGDGATPPSEAESEVPGADDLAGLDQDLGDAAARGDGTAATGRSLATKLSNAWTTAILAAGLTTLPSDAASERDTRADGSADLAAEDTAPETAQAAAQVGLDAADAAATLAQQSEEDATSAAADTRAASPTTAAAGPTYDIASDTFAPVPAPSAGGSSTPPDLLRLTAQAADDGSAMREDAADAEPAAGVSGTPTAFAISDSDFTIVVGAAGDLADFSAITPTPPSGPPVDATQDQAVQGTATGETGAAPVAVALAANYASGAGNGVYVDLAADDVYVSTAQGAVSVQAWRLDADGRVGQALAHIEGVDIIVTSRGDDIVVGDGDANTFIYTPPSTVSASREAVSISATPLSFDVYVGGPLEPDSPVDAADTVDFSRIDQETLAAADGATGLHIDLGASVVAATVDPLDGADGTTLGTLVTTAGGGAAQALALLAWSEETGDGGDDAGPAGTRSMIENIIGSQGDDHIRGDRSDNVLTGGGGSDTFDFTDFGAGEPRAFGHDQIRDFKAGGDGVPDGDTLVFSSAWLAASEATTVSAFLDAYGRDESDSFRFVFDDDSSLTLDHVSRHDFEIAGDTSRDIAIVDGHFFYI